MFPNKLMRANIPRSYLNRQQPQSTSKQPQTTTNHQQTTANHKQTTTNYQQTTTIKVNQIKLFQIPII